MINIGLKSLLHKIIIISIPAVLLFIYWLYIKDISTYDDCAQKGFALKEADSGMWRCAIPGTNKEFFFYEER